MASWELSSVVVSMDVFSPFSRLRRSVKWLYYDCNRSTGLKIVDFQVAISKKMRFLRERTRFLTMMSGRYKPRVFPKVIWGNVEMLSECLISYLPLRLATWHCHAGILEINSILRRDEQKLSLQTPSSLDVWEDLCLDAGQWQGLSDMSRHKLAKQPTQAQVRAGRPASECGLVTPGGLPQLWTPHMRIAATGLILKLVPSILSSFTTHR